MWTPIDNYCERTDVSLMAEPLNLFSNAAFFVAAFLASRELKNIAPEKQRPFRIMLILCVMVGVGSSLFHSFAVRWAELADVIPIMMFIVFYIGLFFRVILRSSWPQVGIAYLGFVLATVFFALTVNPEWVNRSQNYLGTMMFLFVLFAFAKRAKISDARQLIFAAVVFVLSITARSLDMKVCDVAACGTHFLWHTLNGVVLYLVMRAAMVWAARTR